MFGWRWTRRYAALLGGAILLLLHNTAWAVRPWSELAGRWSENQQRHEALQQERTTLREKVKQLALQIQKLKRDAERGGLFALPSRMRLSSVRAKAQVWGQKLERTERAWQAHARTQERLRRSMLLVIRKNLYSLQMRWNAAKDKNTRKKVRKAIVLWASRARMIHPALQEKRPVRAIKTPIVQIDPLDGPAEIRQKVDTLRDQEDRIQRRMKQLQRRLRSLEQEHHRNQKDQKLAQRVSDMTAEDEIFRENDSNPRVGGGREKKVASARTDSAQAPQGSPNTGTQSGSSDPNRGGTSTPPKTGSFENSAPSPAPSTPPTQSDSLKGGVQNAPQTWRPRLGLLPSERAHATSRDPMNPTGSLEEQIKALRRYKSQLKRQVRTLRKKQRSFLKKAERIERVERQRRIKKRR